MDYSLKEVFKDNPQGYADYKAGQKAGKYSDYQGYLDSSGVGNSVVQNAIKMNQEAVKPAIQSYEASIPEIQASSQQQRTQLQVEQGPLEQRYKNLLDSIKGNQTTSENRQTLTTANELARRGISNDSGVFQQELTNAVNPVTQQYTSLYANTGLEGEKAMRDLSNQIQNTYSTETEQTRAIRNAIAQLQSGAGQAGITQGINQQNASQAQAAAQAQAQRDAAIKERELALQTLLTNYNINKPYYNPNTSTTGSEWE